MSLNKGDFSKVSRNLGFPKIQNVTIDIRDKILLKITCRRGFPRRDDGSGVQLPVLQILQIIQFL